MARSKIVTVNEKNIIIREKRIGELETLVKELFPESKGKLSEIDLNELLGNVNFSLLYDKLPKIFPELTKDDMKNAYMSELEAILGAFVDVNFRGFKRLLQPLMSISQMILTQTGLARK